MPAVTLRLAEERDLERAGEVNFLAFYHAALSHGLRPGVSTPSDGQRYLRHLLGVDPEGGVVAEELGRIVGVAWVHARGPVATVGPVAVDPRRQGHGIGRLLVSRCLEIAGRGAAQVRLVQESYNATSLGLYLRAGFRIVAPLLDLELRADTRLTPSAAAASIEVRAATAADRARIVARDARAFGAARERNVDLYLGHGRALVVEGGGGLAGYALGIGFGGTAYLGSAAADDAATLLALLASLGRDLGLPDVGLRVIVPATDRTLVDGLGGLGFRVFRACHYMVRGGGTAPPANYVLMNGDML